MESLKNFLSNNNQKKILIIIGDKFSKLKLLEEYQNFINEHEKKLSIYLPDYANSHYPYFYLNLYEKKRKLYLNKEIEMYNPYILYIQGEQIQCPYYSIHEDKKTFVVKQIYVRFTFDDFVKALLEEYGTDNCVISY